MSGYPPIPGPWLCYTFQEKISSHLFYLSLLRLSPSHSQAAPSGDSLRAYSFCDSNLGDELVERKPQICILLSCAGLQHAALVPARANGCCRADLFWSGCTMVGSSEAGSRLHCCCHHHGGIVCAGGMVMEGGGRCRGPGVPLAWACVQRPVSLPLQSHICSLELTSKSLIP